MKYIPRILAAIVIVGLSILMIVCASWCADWEPSGTTYDTEAQIADAQAQYNCEHESIILRARELDEKPIVWDAYCRICDAFVPK